mgnify:FL=1
MSVKHRTCGGGSARCLSLAGVPQMLYFTACILFLLSLVFYGIAFFVV